MARPKTANGLNEKIEGVEKFFKECVVQMRDEIKEVKDSIRDLKTNDLAHMKQDIEELKKFMWKVVGAVGLVWALIQIGLKFWTPGK